MTDLELHTFYEDLVRQLRARGVVCGITSGLACVHYGVAETTKDCDLLCHPESFKTLVALLIEIRLQEHLCRYRGHISPPLDAAWHRGGWTSHFLWNTKPDVTTLDVFGYALRQSSPWENELDGLYAGMNIVAEMKRTDREKDWPFITSLGTNLIRARDGRGWLHLFDADMLLELQSELSITGEHLAIRPVLRLAVERDARLRPALMAERLFWQELDRLRIRIYRAALRPYVLAMGRARIPEPADLLSEHLARLQCAEQTLRKNPIREHGVERLIEDARRAVAAFVRPELLQWLPDVRPHFTYLDV